MEIKSLTKIEVLKNKLQSLVKKRENMEVFFTIPNV